MLILILERQYDDKVNPHYCWNISTQATKKLPSKTQNNVYKEGWVITSTINKQATWSKQQFTMFACVNIVECLAINLLHGQIKITQLTWKCIDWQQFDVCWSLIPHEGHILVCIKIVPYCCLYINYVFFLKIFYWMFLDWWFNLCCTNMLYHPNEHLSHFASCLLEMLLEHGDTWRYSTGKENSFPTNKDRFSFYIRIR